MLGRLRSLSSRRIWSQSLGVRAGLVMRSDTRCYHSAVTPNDSKEFSEMMERLTPLLQKFVDESQLNPQTKTLVPRSLKDVSARMQVGRLNTQGGLPKNGVGMEGISDEIATILEHSVRTNKPQYMDKLSTGSDSIGSVTGLLLGVLNNNVHTYRTSPALTAIEQSVTRALCRLFFGEEQAAHADGAFVPGGTFTVFQAIRMARDKAFPEFLSEGLSFFDGKPKPVVLASEQMHYSVTLGAQTCGLGKDGVIKIKTSVRGCMDTNHLRETLERLNQEGSKQQPFLVSCLAGSTVFGGFDDFVRIRELCDEFGCLMHVDACWGGAVAFSPETAQLMRGSEMADYIGFDAHKLLSMPLICSAFLAKDRNDLACCMPTSADYIFHKELAEQSPDIGPRTLQCGRNGDALKVYLAWLYYGEDGLSKRVRHCMDNAQCLYDMVLDDARFIAVQPPHERPMYANVSFWYVGPGSECGGFREDILQWRKLGYAKDFVPSNGTLTQMRECMAKSTMRINDSIKLDGKWAVDYAPMPALGLPHFFRAVTGNYRLTPEHLADLLCTIADTAAEKNASHTVAVESPALQARMTAGMQRQAFN